MNFKSTFIALSVSTLLFSGMASAAITGTSSVELTIKSKIVSGTCTAKVLNGAGTASSEIAFGDVYKSDVANKTRVEPLKIAFTNCSGDSYAAGLSTGFEIWSGSVDTGVMLSCKRPPAAQEVTIADGAAEFPMSSRIVIAKDKTIANVGTGAVTAPVTFTVTYP